MTLPDLFDGDRAVVPATLRGYRMWRALYAGSVAYPVLCSTARECAWPLEGTEAALCLREALGLEAPGRRPGERHVPPVKGCSCGFYAWYHPDDTRIVRADIFGVVDASGSVVMGTHGFRAERARIRAVSLDGLLPFHLDRFRRALVEAGIEVFQSRSELVAAHPPEGVGALVQHICDERCGASPAAAAARAKQMQHAMMTALQLSHVAPSPRSSLSSWTAANPAIGVSGGVYPHVPRTPVPRWKQLPAVFVSGFFLAFCVFELGVAGWRLLSDPSWTALALTALYGGLSFVWRRNAVRAWRWRWQR